MYPALSPDALCWIGVLLILKSDLCIDPKENDLHGDVVSHFSRIRWLNGHNYVVVRQLAEPPTSFPLQGTPTTTKEILAFPTKSIPN